MRGLPVLSLPRLARGRPTHHSGTARDATRAAEAHAAFGHAHVACVSCVCCVGSRIEGRELVAHIVWSMHMYVHTSMYMCSRLEGCELVAHRLELGDEMVELSSHEALSARRRARRLRGRRALCVEREGVVARPTHPGGGGTVVDDSV